MSLRAQTSLDGPALDALLDRTLVRVTSTTGPGCTIGVQRGDLVIARARGVADLERAVALTPASVIEAGSVSKQFTAAAVLLLALDGALSLDDDIRRWFPELPVYDAPITVRHLLTHTSGLRDWGAIVQLEGWPRGTRAHTNAHVVQVASRQRALNYTPGLAYSYTNTGYNLLAVLVERVSGRSLADFSRERLFTPLGMTQTSWRDDHRRVVRGRALAYSAGTSPGLNMPDESAYGNGGLLTTADDLLRWTDALRRRAFGDAFARAQVQRMVLTGGDTIDYALGVNVLSHRGTVELSHSGSTGGYRAHLLAFPERETSVSVLCNGSGLNASQIAEQLADSIVGARGRRVARITTVRRPMAAIAEQPALPATQYAQLVGTYASDEVSGPPLVVTLEEGALVLSQAPSLRRVLAQGRGRSFQTAGQVFWFDLDPTGRATALHVAQDRAWDVRFSRVSTGVPMEPLLQSLTGQWQGSSMLWFMPTDPGFESTTTATIAMEAKNTVASLRYDWSHDGEPHAGVLLVRDVTGEAKDSAPPALVWVDSFHTSGTFMLLGGGERTGTRLTATGSYAAPTGPDWGWRIELHVESPTALLVRHYNILPDGQEALAVESRYTRVASNGSTETDTAGR